MNKNPEAVQYDQLILVDSEPGAFAFYTWQNIIFSFWPCQATGAAVIRHKKIFDALVEAHPEGISTIHIISDSASIPTSEARSLFVEIMKQHSKKIACVAIVLLGGGFWASALRAAVTGMRMLAPNTFPLHMYDNIEELKNWLPDEHLKRTNVPLDSSKLVSLLLAAQRELIPQSKSGAK
jgi:hypothetical protein